MHVQVVPRGRSDTLACGGALELRDAPPHSHSVACVPRLARDAHLCERSRTCEGQVRRTECRDELHDERLGALRDGQLDALHGGRRDGHRDK